MDKKHILCFGDSNTWGYASPEGERFADSVRWPRQLARLLGEDWLLAESGLNGRTTVFDDPLGEGMSGLAHLLPIMSAHAPLSLMVVMLGTNDCKQRFAATPQNIALGLARLIRKAQQAECWADESRVLVVAPMVMDQRLYHTEARDGMGEGAVEKSQQLPRLFRQVAEDLGCGFLDSNGLVTANPRDWMHLDAASQAPLARAVYDAVRGMMP